MTTPESYPRKIVDKFKSQSEEGVVYEVYYEIKPNDPVPDLKCTCNGYRYHEKCWHVECVEKLLKENHAKRRQF